MSPPDRGPAPPVRGSGLRTGCAVVGTFVAVVLVGGLAFGLWAIANVGGPGMSPLPRPESRIHGEIVLDPGNDAAELTFRLTVSEAGLPEGVHGIDPSAYLELDLDTVVADGGEPIGSGEDAPGAPIDVAVGDLDLAAAIRPMSPVAPGADVRFALLCEVGEACDRMFVVWIERGDAVAPDTRLDIAWRMTAELRHVRGVTLNDEIPLMIELADGGEDR
jgi:hypothetical protein